MQTLTKLISLLKNWADNIKTNLAKNHAVVYLLVFKYQRVESVEFSSKSEEQKYNYYNHISIANANFKKMCKRCEHK
jgi:hypothetical protein